MILIVKPAEREKQRKINEPENLDEKRWQSSLPAMKATYYYCINKR